MIIKIKFKNYENITVKEWNKVYNNLGDFKLEYYDESMIIYGRKTYCIGKEIKISGINKKNY